MHHAGVVRRVARRSLCGWRAGTRREGGAVPAEEGAHRPSQPQLWKFSFALQNSKGIQRKKKSFNSSDVFPGSHRRERPKAPPLAWGGFPAPAPLRPHCPLSQALRDCPLVSPCQGQTPRAASPPLLLLKQQGGCGLPPGEPCGAGDRWWHGGNTPDCAIGMPPGREQGADTRGTERGSVQAQAGQGGK